MRQDAGALARQLRALELDRRFDTVVVCDRKLGGVGKASAVAARLVPLRPDRIGSETPKSTLPPHASAEALLGPFRADCAMRRISRRSVRTA